MTAQGGTTGARTRLRAWIAGGEGASLRRGAAALADQGVVSFASFATGVVVARSCSKAEFGLYALGLAIVLFLATIQTALVSTPYVVLHVRMADDEQRTYAGSTLLHQLALAAVSAALLLVAARVAGPRAGAWGMGAVLLVLVAAVFPLLAREYARQLAFAKLRFGAALALDGAAAAAQVAALLALAAAHRLTAALALAAMGGACALALTAWSAAARRWFLLRPRRALRDLRSSWDTGRFSVANGLLALGGAQLYPWFVAAWRGNEEVGVLAACMGVTYLANPLVTGLGNYLAPRAMHSFAAGGIDAVRHVLRRVTLLLAGVVALVCPVMVFAGGALLRLVYGERYAGFGVVVALLALAQAVDVLSLGANYALFFMGGADAIVKGNAVVLLVALTAGLALVRWLGPLGVGVGVLAGNAASAAYRWQAYARLLRTAGERPAATAPAFGVGA